MLLGEFRYFKMCLGPFIVKQYNNQWYTTVFLYVGFKVSLKSENYLLKRVLRKYDHQSATKCTDAHYFLESERSDTDCFVNSYSRIIIEFYFNLVIQVRRLSKMSRVWIVLFVHQISYSPMWCQQYKFRIVALPCSHISR